MQLAHDMQLAEMRGRTEDTRLAEMRRTEDMQLAEMQEARSSSPDGQEARSSPDAEHVGQGRRGSQDGDAGRSCRRRTLQTQDACRSCRRRTLQRSAQDTPPRVTRGHCRDNHELDDGPPAQDEVLNNITPWDDRAREREQVVVLHAAGAAREPSRAAAEPTRCQRCSGGRVEAEIIKQPPVERPRPVEFPPRPKELPPVVLNEEDIFCLEFDAHQREESVCAKRAPTMWRMDFCHSQWVWRKRDSTGAFATELEKALWNYSLAQILRDPAAWNYSLAQRLERGQNARLRAFLKYQLEKAIRQFAGDMWPRPVKMAVLVGDMDDLLSGPPKDFDSLFTFVDDVPENLHRVYFARNPPRPDQRDWATALGLSHGTLLLPYDPAGGITTGYVQIDNSEFTLQNPLPDGTPRFVPKLDPLRLVYREEHDDSGIDLLLSQSMVCACDWQSRSGPDGLPRRTCGGLSVDPDEGVFAAFARHLMRPHGVQLHQLKSESNERSGWGPELLEEKLRASWVGKNLEVKNIRMLPDASWRSAQGGAVVVLAPPVVVAEEAAAPQTQLQTVAQEPMV